MGHRLPGSAGFQPAASSRKWRYEHRSRAGSPRSHGTTNPGSYLPQAIRAGPRREFQSPIRGRGLRRATSVQTPITVRAKLAFGRHAPLRERPLCPKQTPCTRFREPMQPRVVPCASARRRRRGGNLHGTSDSPLIRGRGPPARRQAPSSAAQYNPLQKEPASGPATPKRSWGRGVVGRGSGEQAAP